MKPQKYSGINYGNGIPLLFLLLWEVGHSLHNPRSFSPLQPNKLARLYLKCSDGDGPASPIKLILEPIFHRISKK